MKASLSLRYCLKPNMSLPTYKELNAHYASFCKGDSLAYKKEPNRIAKKLSIISAEVDDMINNPYDPADMMYPFNENIEYTNPDTYADPRNWDEDYEEYANGYPSDAEDLDDCMVSSDDEDNYD